MRKPPNKHHKKYNKNEHNIHKFANKHSYKTVICCNVRSLTQCSSKLYVYRLFTTFTFLNDMNETNLLCEGHNTCVSWLLKSKSFKVYLLSVTIINVFQCFIDLFMVHWFSFLDVLITVVSFCYRWYENQNLGEFILYKHKTYPQEVRSWAGFHNE